MSDSKGQRTCISCRKLANKYELKRIVRTPSGQVRFDVRGNAAGRGCYVCSKVCFEEAVSHNKLSRALRARVDDRSLVAIKEALDKVFEGFAGRGE